MIMMKRHLAVAAIAAAGSIVGSPTFAQPYSDSARVLSATPIYDRVSEPRRECRTEYVTTDEHPSGSSAPIGAIAGGVVGGLLGHQIGSGRGNTAATIGGAVAGAAIGNQYDRGRSDDTYVEPQTRAVERCDTVEDSHDVVRGYHVVYRYEGREYTTELPYDPGPRLRIDESGRPYR